MKNTTPNCYRGDDLTTGTQGVDPTPNPCHTDHISGGEASRSKHFTQPFTFFNIMFKFQSSAIENISEVQDGQVTVTFNGGRDYTYNVTDPAEFVADLNLVIENEDSVGKFINLAIRGDQLTQVTAAVA